MNKQELIIKSDAGLDAMLYAATWIEKETKEMERDKTWLSKVLNEFDKPKKVVIPKFAAERIEKAKGTGYTLAYVINQTSGELGKWLHTYDLDVDGRGNQELFAEAWVNGYEVEEEQKYYVDLDTAAYVAKWNGDNQVGIYTDGVFGNDEFEFHLTEQEIKNYDERFWPFAVEVAE